MFCSAGVRPLQAIEQKDGCWEKLAGHLVNNLRPVLKVNESTKPEDAHLPVVEAATNNVSLGKNKLEALPAFVKP